MGNPGYFIQNAQEMGCNQSTAGKSAPRESRANVARLAAASQRETWLLPVTPAQQKLTQALTQPWEIHDISIVFMGFINHSIGIDTID